MLKGFNQKCKYQYGGNMKIENIKILVDSREKVNEHILQIWDKKGIEYYKPEKGLKTGDYSIAVKLDNGEVIDLRDKIVIERKNSLEELSTNVTKHRERFENELKRAKDNNTKFILMIEGVKWYEDLLEGNYNTFTHKNSYLASIMAFKSRYRIEVIGIDKQYTASYIYKELYYFAKEYVKNLC